MFERIQRIIRMDWPVFKEIEVDPNATGEAAVVVAIATLLSALGSAAGSDAFARTFLSELVGGVVGWVVWSAVTYLVGKSLFRSSGTFEQMLRVIGYASAPRALGLLNAIPCIGWLGALAGVIIALIAGVMAIAEGLNLDVGQAILVTVIGWIAQLVVFIIIAIIFGSAAAFFSILTGLFTR